MAHELTVLALFDRRESGEWAAGRLVQAGFPAEQVGYLEPFDVRKLKNPAKAAAKGIAAGSSSGLLIGGILAAIAVGLVPGVGPVLVAGALLPLVMGAVTGGATGAVAGGLIDSETGSEEDPYFMEEVQAGRILVSVEVPDAEAEERAAGLLRESTPLEVDTLGTARLHAKLRHPQARRDEDSTEATRR
jgi:hypothetical protein